MKDLSLLSKTDLLNHTQFLADEDKRISLLLIEALAECEKRMLHLEMGFSSLWEFAVKYLKLSEASAQLRISAMRLARENSRVMESLKTGELSLSNAAQLQSFFRERKKEGELLSPEKKDAIIQSVSGLSKKECERTLLALAPEALPVERERPVSGSHTQISLTVDDVLLEKLKRIKDLLSHQLPEATYADLLGFMADDVLTRLEKKKSGSSMRKASQVINSVSLDPVSVGSSETFSDDSLCLEKVDEPVGNYKSGAGELESSTRASQLSAGTPLHHGGRGFPEFHEQPVTSQVTAGPGPSPRRYIPVAIRRAVWSRAGGRCEFRGTGNTRCTSRHRLELDHRVPLALGGSDDPKILRILCKNHNLQQAAEIIGTARMKRFVPSLR